MNRLRQIIKNERFIFDGAMGTYYNFLYNNDYSNELPERANLEAPERIADIHKRYINAGANILRTNTYASNMATLGCDEESLRKNIEAAVKIAKEAAVDNTEIYIAGDIGPISYQLERNISEEYIMLSKIMLDNDVDAICFETFSGITDIEPALEYIHKHSDAVIIVQFAISQFGYTDAGLSVNSLIDRANENPYIDVIGLNCGVGPGHMHKIYSGLHMKSDKVYSALPNAGYPNKLSNRMSYVSDNIVYFADKIAQITQLGVNILGGCCGTTPEYIRCMKETLADIELVYAHDFEQSGSVEMVVESTAFYDKTDKKLIAVELAPPLSNDDKKLMEAAHILKKSKADVINFPDSPSGRTRVDSILMAEKVYKETGLCVMPHLCCRDKNAIAMRSQILGAGINNINNFLIITGDPVPAVERQAVKSVFNFDSVGLMNIVKDMNAEYFKKSPVTYGGAINQNRLRLDYEIGRVKKKMEAGATFFMTQPVFDEAGVEKLRRIKKETGARILCGIMPFVSYKNAVFMKNEMSGIDVSDEIIEMYKDCDTKEAGEQTGINISRRIIELTLDFIDGYYFSFPFNRVYLLEPIIKGLI